MGLSLVALDYSRSLLSLFKQTMSAGRIHSAFPRVMNITFADIVSSIASEELQRTPNGIRISSLHMNAIFRIVEKDMTVCVREKKFFIPACGCTIYLPEKEPWEPRPDIEHYSWDHRLVVQHTNLLIKFLIDKSSPEGLGILASPLLTRPQTRRGVGLPRPFFPKRFGTPQERAGQAHAPTETEANRDGLCNTTGSQCVYGETPLRQIALPLLRLLMVASWRQDRGGIEQAVKGLAGLGPGLTPSGDDVLAGFAAVMFLLSEQLSVDGVSRRYIAELIASTACPRTTLLSGTFLRCAARGEVSEPLGQLLMRLTLPLEESETVLKAAEHVLDFGASSGSDTLLGVLAGLRTLEGEQDYGFASSAQAQYLL